ncbi:hypothetical protein [Bdellovibrio sp. HCB337]|uniref:hypothetical protein n=1 Tax=Bdellovibrio sp. HCB337 TaxID=3394358 RepID=UPI0039A6C10E
MRKIVIIVVILLALVWVKMSSDEEYELGETSDSLNAQEETVHLEDPDDNEPTPVVSPTPPIKTSVPETSQPSPAPTLVVEATPIQIQQEHKPQPTPFEKTGEQVAEEKLNIPIDEELKQAIPLTTWTTTEPSRFTGFFYGYVELKGQKHHVRLRLAFDGSNGDVAPGSCVTIYGSGAPLYSEKYANGKMKVFRTKEEKYIILSISDQVYLQIFQTTENRQRTLRVHLTTKSDKRPVIFYLNHSRVSGIVLEGRC